MRWAYVAGYFDGEGAVSFHQGKRRNRICAVTWCNSHLESLQLIQTFVGAGGIHKRAIKGLSTKHVYALRISKRSELLRIVPRMIPHLIIKRAQCEAMLNYVRESIADQPKGFGKAVAVETETLRRWYEDEGKSYASIGRMLGVTVAAVWRVIHQRGIKPREAGGRFMKGVPKSEETRRRMKASRRRMWRDPTFRAAQLANLARSRK